MQLIPGRSAAAVSAHALPASFADGRKRTGTIADGVTIFEFRSSAKIGMPSAADAGKND